MAGRSADRTTTWNRVVSVGAAPAAGSMATSETTPRPGPVAATRHDSVPPAPAGPSRRWSVTRSGPAPARSASIHSEPGEGAAGTAMRNASPAAARMVSAGSA